MAGGYSGEVGGGGDWHVEGRRGRRKGWSQRGTGGDWRRDKERGMDGATRSGEKEMEG